MKYQIKLRRELSGQSVAVFCVLACLAALGLWMISGDLIPGVAARSSSAAAMPLGNYADTNVVIGGNVTIVPDAPPIGVASVNVSAGNRFKGLLAVDSTTGAVRVTNAYPAGQYTVTVRGFGPGADTKTFALNVGSGTPCGGMVQFGAGSEESTLNVPVFVAVGDFNKDGIQDLAVANQNSISVGIYTGNGSGQLTFSNLTTVGATPVSIAVADFNNDGNLDMAVATADANAVVIRIGNGSGGFGNLASVPAPNRPVSVVAGDFNNDGNRDLAIANIDGATVSIRLGNGTGSFAGTTEVPVGIAPRFVAIGDFNNDGNADFAVTNQNINTVSVRLGNGVGGFSGTTELGVGTRPIGITIADFNADGNQDLAVANLFSNTISVRMGNGLGGFSGTTNVSVGAGPFEVAAGDFNNDGREDIATTSRDANLVSVRFGDGFGGFSGTTGVSVAAAPIGFAVGDFNRDGIQDFTTANAADNSISVRIGSCVGTPVATISGKVVTPAELSLRNAVVALIDAQGVRRTATTSSFGVYSFANVAAGQTYTLTVSSKRYRFTPKVLQVNGDLMNVDFVGLE